MEQTLARRAHEMEPDAERTGPLTLEGYLIRGPAKVRDVPLNLGHTRCGDAHCESACMIHRNGFWTCSGTSELGWVQMQSDKIKPLQMT